MFATVKNERVMVDGIQPRTARLQRGVVIEAVEHDQQPVRMLCGVEPIRSHEGIERLIPERCPDQMDQADLLSHSDKSMDAAEVLCWACTARVGSDPVFPGYSRCTACQLLFAPERDAEELRRLYHSSYFAAYRADGGYDADQRQRDYEAALRLDLIRGVCRSGRVVELGSAGGYFLAALNRAGYAASGIEPAAEIAQSARDRFGVEVFTGVVDEAPLEDASLDVVCGWHVLEHIRDPLTVIERLSRALRPGGHALFEVPNIASVRARRDGDRWKPLEPTHHVSNFTPQALTALMERGGFSDVRTETVSFLTYLPRAALLRPRSAVGVVKEALVAGNPLRAHPEHHELLRVVATRP